MKLALIAYLHGAGGAERQMIMLANEMADRGHDLYLLVLCENKAPYPIELGVKVCDLSYADNFGKIPQISRYKALKRELALIKPDITINYNVQGTYFSLLIGKNVCGKVLYSERGDPYDKEYSGFRGIVRDLTCKKVDAFVFQSEGARDFFKLKERQKAVVIHNSVTVPQDRYPMPEKRDNRIVTVGRLHPQKNPWLLLEAFCKIANCYQDVTLEYYGDGRLKAELEKRVDEMCLTGRVHLYPSRKDIFDCIRTARMFVLPSDYEGMPNALMEAMSLGLPCVSADCRPGGARTLIESGKNGLIVPVRDVDAMAKAIAYMLDNPDRTEEMGKEARHLGETHTNKVVFDKWNEFLYSLNS